VIIRSIFLHIWQAGCLAKVVNGYWNTVDQPRSVLGFYGRSTGSRLVLFPYTGLGNGSRYLELSHGFSPKVNYGESSR
jgi:hypothetical protein